MKISVNNILFYWFTKKPKNFMNKSFQVSWFWNPKLEFDIHFDFVKSFGSIFDIRINLFGLFDLYTYKDEEVDHAGFSFTLNILGLDFEYTNRDIRHWDYDNDCPEKYEEEPIPVDFKQLANQLSINQNKTV